MIALLTIAASLISLSPSSTAITSNVSSDLASYDGDTIQLEGHVSLNHELGFMEAQKAFIQKNSDSDLFHLSQIDLENDVTLCFRNQAELFCEKAHLDFQNIKGIFTSNDYPVLYRDYFQEKKLPLELFGREVEITLEKSDNHFQIASLLTKGSVHINYGTDFHLDADEALYHTEGTLKAYSETPQTLCHLTHLDDYIDAHQIEVNLNQKQLVMHHPKGVISSYHFPNIPTSKCHISSNHLTWDAMNDTLTLRGNIALKDDAFGMLQSKRKVHLIQNTRSEKNRGIQAVEAYGKTLLTSHDGQKLTSFGTLKINQDTLSLVCESPTLENEVLPGKQLIYEKDTLTLWADTASLEYSANGSQLEPHTVNLNGHVRIISHETTQPFRCGIADHIQYSPNTGEILLLSNSGNNVLFWHEKQNLKMSACEILITIDPQTKEESIKGKGTIRLAFNQEEDKLLETLFPYYR